MFALSLTMFLVVTGAFQAPAPTVKDVAWIAGCWEYTRGTRHVTEHWMPVEGGTMIGVSRTVTNGKTTEWEFLIIREGATGLEYVAKPSGQPDATFTAPTASASEVVFENPAHDFPKRISYTRDGDSLVASIAGPMNGQTRKIDFPYKKAACGG
ncbi:MAG: DUF6265 family protein [Vicinamibacterales bacterium]